MPSELTAGPPAEPSTLQVLEQLDLDALRERFAEEGFEVLDWPYPDSHIAGHAKLVRAVTDEHCARLEQHHLLAFDQLLPTDRTFRDWPRRVAEAIRMLRTATGRTHADLGPTTQTEAAFCA